MSEAPNKLTKLKLSLITTSLMLGLSSFSSHANDERRYTLFYDQFSNIKFIIDSGNPDKEERWKCDDDDLKCRLNYPVDSLKFDGVGRCNLLNALCSNVYENYIYDTVEQRHKAMVQDLRRSIEQSKVSNTRSRVEKAIEFVGLLETNIAELTNDQKAELNRMLSSIRVGLEGIENLVKHKNLKIKIVTLIKGIEQYELLLMGVKIKSEDMQYVSLVADFMQSLILGVGANYAAVQLGSVVAAGSITKIALVFGTGYVVYYTTDSVINAISEFDHEIFSIQSATFFQEFEEVTNDWISTISPDEKRPIDGALCDTLCFDVPPLVIDLNKNGLTTLGFSPERLVDYDNDGYGDFVSWFGPEEGIIGFDFNENGLIETKEYVLKHLNPANDATDYDGFKLLDFNSDGKISFEDEDFSYLKIWIDKNSDLISTEDEVFTPDDLGISYFDLNYEALKVDKTRAHLVFGKFNAITENDNFYEVYDVAYRFKAVGGIKNIFENENYLIHQHVTGEKALVLSSDSSLDVAEIIKHTNIYFEHIVGTQNDDFVDASQTSLESVRLGMGNDYLIANSLIADLGDGDDTIETRGWELGITLGLGEDVVKYHGGFVTIDDFKLDVDEIIVDKKFTIRDIKRVNNDTLISFEQAASNIVLVNVLLVDELKERFGL